VQRLIKVKVQKNTLPLFLQYMADAQKNQWIPVYSQSPNDINQGHLPQIPNTPPTLHIRHSASAGNLRAQTSPFFDTPADLRSTQYVAYQPHLYPAPTMQGHWGKGGSEAQTPVV
jgi:hypothetical protein